MNPTPPAPGSAPRDVFAAACAALAAYGAEHGFVYRKSRRALVRQRGRWIDEIQLQTLTSNAPEHVALLVWIAAHHKGLENWRASRPERSSLRGFVLRSSLGYLTPLARHVEWNVAPTTFRAPLIEVTRLLEEFGLPFLDALHDPGSMIEAALNAGYEPTFVEYLVSEGSIASLEEFPEALQRRRPPLYDTDLQDGRRFNGTEIVFPAGPHRRGASTALA